LGGKGSKNFAEEVDALVGIEMYILSEKHIFYLEVTCNAHC